MPRVARIVVPGVPHHVTQRGNNRQLVFLDDDDRNLYLRALRRQLRRSGVRTIGYCLMSNHVHLVAVPRSASHLAKAVGSTHLRCTHYFNRRYGCRGHLWENRFYSCPMDLPHSIAALRYVERNPVRAGLVRAAWDYRWSSAAAHCSGSDPTGVLDDATDTLGYRDWKEILAAGDIDGDSEQIRQRTRDGRPLGGAAFVTKLEADLGCRLRPGPMGRPSTNSDRR